MVAVGTASCFLGQRKSSAALPEEKGKADAPAPALKRVKGHGESKEKEATASFPGGQVAIYFGSQTGTAESFAKALGREGREKGKPAWNEHALVVPLSPDLLPCSSLASTISTGFETSVIDLEEFDPEQLRAQKLAIFVLATYGEGDPTDNAMEFAKWLKNQDGSLGPDYLASTNYAVFG